MKLVPVVFIGMCLLGCTSVPSTESSVLIMKISPNSRAEYHANSVLTREKCRFLTEVLGESTNVETAQKLLQSQTEAKGGNLVVSGFLIDEGKMRGLAYKCPPSVRPEG